MILLKGVFFMRKICITFLLLFIIFVTASCTGFTEGYKAENAEFLRIHVRANSNSDKDQSIKYYIKDEIVQYLTPHIAQCHNKDEAVIVIEQKKKTLEYIIYHEPEEPLSSKSARLASHSWWSQRKFPNWVENCPAWSGVSPS